MFEVIGFDQTVSSGRLITCDQRIANPFNPANLTLAAANELSNSTANNWMGFFVICRAVDNLSFGILSVFVGASGLEQRIATLPTRYSSRNNTGIAFYVPVAVPSGSRVTVGISGNAVDDYRTQIIGAIDGLVLQKRSFNVLDCGPFILEDDAGTYGEAITVDPGAIVNEKPTAFTQLTYTGANAANNLIDGGGLVQAYDALGFIQGENVNSAQTDQSRLWEFARGAPGSEVTIGNNMFAVVTGAETQLPAMGILGEWGRPAGDQISARFQSSTADAADRIGSAFIVGVR